MSHPNKSILGPGPNGAVPFPIVGAIYSPTITLSKHGQIKPIVSEGTENNSSSATTATAAKNGYSFGPSFAGTRSSPVAFTLYQNYFPDNHFQKCIRQADEKINQLIQVCHDRRDSNKWIEAQVFLTSKMAEFHMNMDRRFLPPPPGGMSLFSEAELPAVTKSRAESFEDYKLGRKFNLRPDAPEFRPTASPSPVAAPVVPPTTISQFLSNAKNSNTSVVPVQPSTASSFVSKVSNATNQIQAPPGISTSANNSASKLKINNNSRVNSNSDASNVNTMVSSKPSSQTSNVVPASTISPIRDDWDEEVRVAMAKATEQIWAEAEAWVDAEAAAEEEEWRILEQGISQYVGLSKSGFHSSSEEISIKLPSSSNQSAVRSESSSFVLDTSMDLALDGLIDYSPAHSSVRYETPSKLDSDSPKSIKSKVSTSGGRSLHEKLSSPDRKRSLSPSEARRRYDAKLMAAESNRDKSVAEKVQKAMITTNRIKMISLNAAKKQAEAEKALQNKFRDAEQRHSENLNKIKGKAGSENAKVLNALTTLKNAQNSEVLALELQQKLEEVEAKILAANQRREQRLAVISGSQKKKNSRKSQQMSEFRLLLEQQKQERWEKLQNRFEAVQERRRKRLEELKRRVKEFEGEDGHYHGISSPNLSSLTLNDEIKFAKTMQTYSPKLTFAMDQQQHHSSHQSRGDSASGVPSPLPEKSLTAMSSPNASIKLPVSALAAKDKTTDVEVVSVTDSEPNSIVSDRIGGDHNANRESSHTKRRRNRTGSHEITSFRDSPTNPLFELDQNLSKSEEIELILFPAVAKAHAQYLEMFNKSKVLAARNASLEMSIACLENDENFYSQLILKQPNNLSPVSSSGKSGGSEKKSSDGLSLTPTKSTISISASTMAGTENANETSATPMSKESPVLEPKALTPLHQIINSIQEVKKEMNEERGASSYNIYASIIKDIRTFGINCHVDLAERVNFLISNLLDLLIGKTASSVSVNDFVRSGGMLLLPVLISHEYGALADLSSIQNFVNSIVVFSRSNTTTTSSSNKPSMNVMGMIQQIEFWNILEAFTCIICHFDVNINILFGLSFPVAVLDLCIYLHYLLENALFDAKRAKSSMTTGSVGVAAAAAGAASSPNSEWRLRCQSISEIERQTSKLLQILTKMTFQTISQILPNDPLPSHHLSPSLRTQETTAKSEDADQAAGHTPASASITNEAYRFKLLQSLSSYHSYSFHSNFVERVFQYLRSHIESARTIYQSKQIDENSLHANLCYFLTGTEYLHSLVAYIRLLKDEKKLPKASAEIVLTLSSASAKANVAANTGTAIAPISFKVWCVYLRKQQMVRLVLDLFQTANAFLFAELDRSCSRYLEKILQLITSAMRLMIDLTYLDQDIFANISSDDKNQLLEEITNYFIVTSFVLDKSKNIAEVFAHVKLRPASNATSTVDVIKQLNDLAEQVYCLRDQWSLSLEALFLLLTRLITRDLELRKMLGETYTKRCSNISGSNIAAITAAVSNNLIAVILFFQNQKILDNQSQQQKPDKTFESSVTTAIVKDEDHSSRLDNTRRSISLLQLIVILPIKYFKDAKYHLKQVLIPCLLVACLELEHNTQLVQHYHKDKFLQGYLEHIFRENSQTKDQTSHRNERAEDFALLVPETHWDLLRLLWLDK